MNQDFLSALHKVTPLTDKVLALAGTSLAAFLTLGHVQTIVGITLGILSCLAIVPRLVIGYVEMKAAIRKAERASEEEEG